MSSSRMPAVYLSHGAPPLADDPIWPGELSAWSAALPRPESILVISAHWENAPTSVSATRTVPLYYDFWGFPKHYYEVTYPAPGAPALAEAVRKLLGGQVHEDGDRGLGLGAHVGWTTARTFRWSRWTAGRRAGHPAVHAPLDPARADGPGSQALPAARR